MVRIKRKTKSSKEEDKILVPPVKKLIRYPVPSCLLRKKGLYSFPQKLGGSLFHILHKALKKFPFTHFYKLQFENTVGVPSKHYLLYGEPNRDEIAIIERIFNVSLNIYNENFELLRKSPKIESNVPLVSIVSIDSDKHYAYIYDEDRYLFTRNCKLCGENFSCKLEGDIHLIKCCKKVGVPVNEEN